MNLFLVSTLLFSVFLSLASSRPQNLEDSISSVIRSLETVEQQRRTRPRIITKYDFINTRDKKSHLEVPPPFVVSTGLTVTQREQKQVINLLLLPPDFCQQFYPTGLPLQNWKKPEVVWKPTGQDKLCQSKRGSGRSTFG